MALDDAPVDRESSSAFVEDEGRTVTLRLPAEPAAVAQARRFVADRWAWRDTGTLDDVELLVSELVSNAVRHGQPEIAL